MGYGYIQFPKSTLFWGILITISIDKGFEILLRYLKCQDRKYLNIYSYIEMILLKNLFVVCGWQSALTVFVAEEG